MSLETVLATCQKLNAQVEMLAAIGAEMRIRKDGLAPDPDVRALIQNVVSAADPQLLDGIEPAQEAMALAFITSFFRQAQDLLDNPARPKGWTYTDPLILNSIGQLSRVVVRAIGTLAQKRPSLAANLAAPGAFLDVGTGTAWLAIEAAKLWPALKVVGIDPFETALALARQNVAATGMESRVELRQMGVEDVGENEQFSLIFYPSPFIPKEVSAAAVPRLAKALKPGGTLVFGLFLPAPTPQGEALLYLRLVRGGGHAWGRDEASGMLGAAGLQEVEVFDSGTPALLVVGKKAG